MTMTDNMLRKEGRKGFASNEDNVDASKQRQHRKARRKTDYSYQKQFRQHED